MAESNELPTIVIERRRGGASAFLWGALLGGAAALLFAPRSGDKTQQEIRDRVFRLRDRTEEQVNNARDNVLGAVDRTRERVQDGIGSVRDTVGTRTRNAREALDAGRQAARETREDLEQRVAEAKGGFGAPDVAPRPGAPPVPPADVVVTEVTIEEVVLPPGQRPGMG